MATRVHEIPYYYKTDRRIAKSALFNITTMNAAHAIPRQLAEISEMEASREVVIHCATSSPAPSADILTAVMNMDRNNMNDGIARHAKATACNTRSNRDNPSKSHDNGGFEKRPK